jgi:hypothetical protein
VATLNEWVTGGPARALEVGRQRARGAAARTAVVAGRRRFRKLAETYELPGGWKRVYCYHIRKTGGTSLHHSFMALREEAPDDVHRRLDGLVTRATSDDLVFVAHNIELIEEGSYFYAWSHNPAHQLELPPGTFTIVVLRDPAERVLSHYRMLLEAPQHDLPFAVPDHERRWVSGTFVEFLDNIPREHLLRQLYMFSSSFDVDEAVERIRSCAAVLFLDDYERGLQDLSVRLNLPLRAFHKRASRRNTVVSQAEVGRLSELLVPEYDMIDRLQRSASTHARQGAPLAARRQP